MIVCLACDDAKTVKLLVASLSGKKDQVLAFMRADLGKELKKSEQIPDFLWYDIAGLDGASLKAALKSLAKIVIPWGIIDRKGIMEDASEAFWAGSADYIGPKTDVSEITAQRLKKALAWKSSTGNASGVPETKESVSKAAQKNAKDNPNPLKTNFIASSGGWTSIREGSEYTFVFVYVQIDKADKLHHSLGETRAAELDLEFCRLIKQSFARCLGQVWMWRDYGGLLLFPFDGKTCPVILDALRLWLDRPIRYAGNPALSVGFTFRMAIHIGNTVYKRPGNTGGLTSDTLNSLFHIGYKFMKSDMFYLTEEAASFIPPMLGDLFVDAGTYEARSIKRMLALL